MRYLLPLLLAFICSIPLHAQSDPLSPEPPGTCCGPALFAGYRGIGEHYGEIGYAYLPSPEGDLTDIGYSISAACRINSVIIAGASASVWLNLPVSPGINLDYYDDLHSCLSLRLRPEIALRLCPVHVAYGYSFFIAEHGIVVNSHTFSARLFLPLN